MSTDTGFCTTDIECFKCGKTIFAFANHIVTLGFGRWDYCNSCYTIKTDNYVYIKRPKFMPDFKEMNRCKYEPKWALA